MNDCVTGCTKLRNEIKTQRTKRNETKRNIADVHVHSFLLQIVFASGTVYRHYE
jgi:hypothetical protein